MPGSEVNTGVDIENEVAGVSAILLTGELTGVLPVPAKVVIRLGVVGWDIVTREFVPVFWTLWEEEIMLVWGADTLEAI